MDDHDQAQNSAQATAPQACRRCRQQKLRCNREIPICSRCERISAVCTYPPPPDRKLLATKRVRKPRNRSSQALDDGGGPARQPEGLANVHGFTRGRLHSSANAYHDNESFNDSDGEMHIHQGIQPMPNVPIGADVRHVPSSTEVTLPSPEVSMALLEIYFARIYNAGLLFHRESFMSDYITNKVPTFVSLSIFAAASIFLRKPQEASFSGFSGEHEISSLSLPDLSDYAKEWATSATQQVMAQAYQPSLVTVQACQTLVMYWFSINHMRQTNILSNLAYTTSRILGCHLIVSDDILPGLDDELRRRCFWSCWMTSCISQDNAHFKGQSWSEVAGLAFPSDETSFAAGRPETSETFDENGKIVFISDAITAGPTNVSEPSYFGGLVKLFSIWWEIQHFVRRFIGENSNNSTARLTSLLVLDRRLETLFEKFPPDHKYLGPQSFTSSKIDPYMLFSLNSLYHLCCCALHSSLVPLFTGCSDPGMSKKFIQFCAGEAVKHSDITLDMATAFSNINLDRTRLSGMNGFAMFVSVTIKFRCLIVQGKVHNHVHQLKGAISIIQRLKECWYHLRGLWAQLEDVFQPAGIDVNTFSNYINRLEPAPPDSRTDIEQITSPDVASDPVPSVDIYTYVTSTAPHINSSRKSTSHDSPATDAQLSPRSSGSHSTGKRKSDTTLPRRPHNDETRESTSTRNIGFGAASHPNAAENIPSLGPGRQLAPSSQIGEPLLHRGYYHHASATNPYQQGYTQAEIYNREPQIQASGSMPNHQTAAIMTAANINYPVGDYQSLNDPASIGMMDNVTNFWWDRPFEGMERDPFGFLIGGHSEPMDGVWFDPST